MKRRTLLIPGGAAGVLVAVLVSTGGGAAPLHTTTARAATTSLIAPYEARYKSESSGQVAHATLSRLARDPGLLAAVRSRSNTRIRRYVNSRFRPVWYHWHVSPMRITRGSATVIETGVPFVVNGPSTTLRDTHGHAIARLQISIQDVIGPVRLNKRLDHVDTVVRGRRSAHVRTSLPAALKVKLPRRGEVTIAGHRYQVGSFHETGWRGEPLHSRPERSEASRAAKPPPFDRPAAETRFGSKQAPESSRSSSASMNATSPGSLPGARVQRFRPELDRRRRSPPPRPAARSGWSAPSRHHCRGHRAGRGRRAAPGSTGDAVAVRARCGCPCAGTSRVTRRVCPGGRRQALEGSEPRGAAGASGGSGCARATTRAQRRPRPIAPAAATRRRGMGQESRAR